MCVVYVCAEAGLCNAVRWYGTPGSWSMVKFRGACVRLAWKLPTPACLTGQYAYCRYQYRTVPQTFICWEWIVAL